LCFRSLITKSKKVSAKCKNGIQNLKKNYLHTIEETFGSKGSQFASGCNNNPLHGTIVGAIIIILYKKFAMLPKEKLLTIRDPNPQVSLNLSYEIN